MRICRLCGNSVKSFLSLGDVPLPEEFRSHANRTNPLITYPTGLSYCTRCFHVQLSRPIESDPIYKKNYFYDYAVTNTGRKHWERLAQYLVKRNKLTARDIVVDVGSNTGTLLSFLKAAQIQILGVDPADKLAKIARTKGIPTITSYFTPAVAKKIVKRYGQASIITCTNVFDHVANLQEITRAFQLLLAPPGTLIIEVPYFYRMITDLTHIVYHQQIDYMMLTSLVLFFKKFELEIVDAQEIALHGGSLRFWVKHTKQGVKPTKRLQRLLYREKKIVSKYPKSLYQFAKMATSQIDDFEKMVFNLKKQNKTIAAVGASAKGITLLHYAGLGSEEIDFITEKSSLKIGRYTPSGIPIVSDTVLTTQQPDYAIVLAWNFQKEVMANLKKYKGTWITPVPHLRLFRKPS